MFPSRTRLLHSSNVPQTHPDVLEEPRAHDIGGVFGQNTAFVLGGVVIVVKEVQVLVKLQLELNADRHRTMESTLSFVPDRAPAPQCSGSVSGSTVRDDYLIVLDAYCPWRQSLCYHLALRSDDCNWLVHCATWKHTHTQLYTTC